MHIVELQHRLQEERSETHQSKVRIRTAAIDDASKLLRSGKFTPEEISYFQGIPLSEVRAEQARIEERNRARRKYLASGIIDDPGQLAHFTILQR
jgi:hypothetical protein